VVTLVTFILSVAYVYYVLNHLPVIDFRPYKINANIEEGMSVPEDAPKSIYEYAWKFKTSEGEKIIVTNGNYPSIDGEYLDVETTEIQEGYEPPIHDFTIEQNGEDFASSLLQMSASNSEQTSALVKKYKLGFEYYFTDETALKTIVRSNPGVLVLEKGTIKQKVHYNDIDELNFE